MSRLEQIHKDVRCYKRKIGNDESIVREIRGGGAYIDGEAQKKIAVIASRVPYHLSGLTLDSLPSFFSCGRLLRP